MLNAASRVLKTLSDVTVGTLIVLAHVALADRERSLRRRRAKRPSSRE